MGNLSSASSFSDLILTATGADADTIELKNQRKKALLEQKNNVASFKKKLGSYRAKMASQGAGALGSSVEAGLIEQMEDENESIADTFNQKIKAKARNNRQKALLNIDDYVTNVSKISS